MAWIIGIIAVLGFAYLMYANERFRRFGFGVLALLGAGIAIFWFLADKESRDYRAQLERERTAISASQLSLTGMRLYQSPYGGWEVEGTVLNRSSYPLKSLTLTVFLRDCPSPSDDAGCVTTGEDDALFYVDVPPGQARKLNSSVQFVNAPELKPGWGWNYGIKAITADLGE